jgi:hypothetical protein
MGVGSQRAALEHPEMEEWLEKIRREEQEIEGTCRVEKLIFKKRSGKEGIELESFKGIAIQLVP